VNRQSTRKKLIIAMLLMFVVTAGILVYHAKQKDLKLSFTQQELQDQISRKFPFEQKLLFISVTYSNPQIVLESASDRVGFALDVSAKLAENQVVKGHAAGDWSLRYEPEEGALYFDDPKIDRIDIGGLSPSTQEQIGRVAKPLIEAYLKRVPVYRLKPEDLRQQVAKAVVKTVNVKNGRLLIVVGLP
jgi:hypothetical protein